MTSDQTKYRLLTRSDFDGLVCAILLKELGILDSIKFVHPKDVQDGKVQVTPNDILTNLPFTSNCHLCFDHHASEEIRNSGLSVQNHVLEPEAPSAARVLYNYFGGWEAFPGISLEMMEAVDKADSARFSREDILNPEGWVLLSFLMDPRTGLGRFREFRISNYELMMELIDHCRTHPIGETLNLPDVRERVELYREQHDKFVDQIKRCTTVHENLAVLDLRQEHVIFAGNRFMIYALFPQCDVSMHIIPGLANQNTVFAVGRSILKSGSKVPIGALMLKYGGGGHDGAGTCQIAHSDAERVKAELIERITVSTGAREPVLA